MPNIDQRTLAVVAFIVLEGTILLARRFAAPLRPGFAFHLWAVVLGLYLGLQNPEVVAVEPAWWRVLSTLLLMLSVLVVYEVLDAFALQQPARGRRGPRLPRVLRDVIRVVLVLVSGILAASYIYDIPLPTVLVSSTVLSAVLGLALQDVLKNVFAGIAVQLEGQVRIGDWLLVDGQAAVLRDVSWRTTHLRTNEGVRILEPNSQFAARRLIHYRAGEPPVAFGFRIGLPYETPPPQAKAALLAAAASAEGALEDPAPVAMVRDYGDSAIEYELRVWTHDVRCIARFRDRVNSCIWDEVQRAGLYIPFPIRTVYLSTATGERTPEAEDVSV